MVSFKSVIGISRQALNKVNGAIRYRVQKITHVYFGKNEENTGVKQPFCIEEKVIRPESRHYGADSAGKIKAFIEIIAPLGMPQFQKAIAAAKHITYTPGKAPVDTQEDYMPGRSAVRVSAKLAPLSTGLLLMLEICNDYSAFSTQTRP